jgi:predicted MFS family arabinose efflux permease
VVDSGTFLVIALVILVVKPRYPAEKSEGRRSFAHDLSSGIRYVASHPILWQIGLFALVLNVVSMPIAQLGIALRAVDSGWGPFGYGMVQASYGVGALLGNVVTMRVRPSPAHTGLIMALLAVPVTLCFIPIAITTWVWLMAVSVMLAGLFLAPVSALLMTTMQHYTPSEFYGRVTSVLILIAVGGIPLGNLALGFLIRQYGLTRTMLPAAVLLIVSGLALLASRTIRSANLLGPPAGPGQEPAP